MNLRRTLLLLQWTASAAAVGLASQGISALTFFFLSSPNRFAQNSSVCAVLQPEPPPAALEKPIIDKAGGGAANFDGLSQGVDLSKIANVFANEPPAASGPCPTLISIFFAYP